MIGTDAQMHVHCVSMEQGRPGPDNNNLACLYVAFIFKHSDWLLKKIRMLKTSIALFLSRNFSL